MNSSPPLVVRPSPFPLCDLLKLDRRRSRVRPKTGHGSYLCSHFLPFTDGRRLKFRSLPPPFARSLPVHETRCLCSSCSQLYDFPCCSRSSTDLKSLSDARSDWDGRIEQEHVGVWTTEQVQDGAGDEDVGAVAQAASRQPPQHRFVSLLFSLALQLTPIATEKRQDLVECLYNEQDLRTALTVRSSSPSSNPY